ALEYTKKLYAVGMTQAVLSWNAASNNQAFNAQETAYILNSISAYRTAQDNKLPVLENYFFTPALKGPTGIQLASEHVMSGYVVWKFSKNQDVAKEFLVALVDASRDSMLGSKLYNFPSFYGAAADPGTPPPKKQESGAAWIAAQCNKDPFGSAPADKLALLAKSLPWSTNLGYRGYAGVSGAPSGCSASSCWPRRSCTSSCWWRCPSCSPCFCRSRTRRRAAWSSRSSASRISRM